MRVLWNHIYFVSKYIETYLNVNLKVETIDSPEFLKIETQLRLAYCYIERALVGYFVPRLGKNGNKRIYQRIKASNFPLENV